MSEIGDIDNKDQVEHLGGKEELLRAYKANIEAERVQEVSPGDITQLSERMRRVIATPDLAELIIADDSKTILVHSTNSEAAENILKEGLYANSLIGLDAIATRLIPISKDTPENIRQKIIADNLRILTSLGDDNRVSGQAKIIIELPKAPQFSEEYGIGEWTPQFVRPYQQVMNKRLGVSDAILSSRYIKGYIDFKEQRYVKNLSFEKSRTGGFRRFLRR